MSKHTPTPWDMRLDDTDGSKQWEIFSKITSDVPVLICGWTEEQKKANAVHIVKCVNMFDELVDALQELLSVIDGSLIVEETTRNQTAVMEIACDKIVQKSRAVLAKAKGDA